MFPINASNTASSSLPFDVTENMDKNELKFFHSIFSDTAQDNMQVEASDFKNYKAGKNEYIDSLIKNSVTWTREIVNNVIDSSKLLQNSKAIKCSNLETSVLDNEKEFQQLNEDVEYLINPKDLVLIPELRAQARELLAKQRAATTDEEKANIKKELEPLVLKIKEISNREKDIESRMLAAGLLETVSITDAHNVRRDIKLIKSKLVLTDSNGVSQNLNVNISLRFIDDYMKNNPDKNLGELLNELSANINNLLPIVKNDLYNEISQLTLLSHYETHEGNLSARAGYYDSQDNQITLLNSRMGTNIKDCVQTLIHELGHAVDDKNSFNGSSEIEITFNELKNKLLEKGLIPKNYAIDYANNNAYYPLTDVTEFFAEMIYNDGNGGEKNFSKLHEILSSHDPEIKALVDTLKEGGDKIIAERRNSSRSERLGLRVGDLKYQLEADEVAYNAYTKLTFSLSDEQYEKFGRGHLDNLLKAYYDYKTNPSFNSENTNLISSFANDYPEEWAIVEKYLMSTIESQGLA